MKKVMVFTVVVSMLFLGVPAPTDAGVVAGVATEWTQILNHVQLIMGYIRQGLQLETRNEAARRAVETRASVATAALWSNPAGFIAARANRSRRASPGVFDGQSRRAVSQYVSGLQLPATPGILTTIRNGRRPRSIRR